MGLRDPTSIACACLGHYIGKSRQSDPLTHANQHFAVGGHYILSLPGVSKAFGHFHWLKARSKSS